MPQIGYRKCTRALRRQRGFTLLEALIAILVLVFGMLGAALLMVRAPHAATALNVYTPPLFVYQPTVLASPAYEPSSLTLYVRLPAKVKAFGEKKPAPVPRNMAPVGNSPRFAYEPAASLLQATPIVPTTKKPELHCDPGTLSADTLSQNSVVVRPLSFATNVVN